MDIKLTWHRPKKLFGLPSYTLLEEIVVADIPIPSGFGTDGTSVPWFLRWLFSVMGVQLPAAILHDYLLYINSNRKCAAYLFYIAMVDDNIPKWYASILWLGVRSWDAVVWLKDNTYGRFKK